MIKYTFVSLGSLESFGIRFGGAGLGNILFPWAKAIIYAKKYNLKRIQTTWKNIKIGPFIRGERDNRMYFNLFSGSDGITGIKKFLLLNFSNKVKVFSGMDGLFETFINDRNFILSELLKIINPSYLQKVSRFNHNSIAIHIRMGDFEVVEDENKLRSGHWNCRLPFKWYKCMIDKIRKESSLPIYIFSDASNEELGEILELEDCQRMDLGSSISDMLALSHARVLIASASTFSMWASFLGQNPTIWFPGQMRQKLITNTLVFEGEIDYDDRLDESLIEVLRND